MELVILDMITGADCLPHDQTCISACGASADDRTSRACRMWPCHALQTAGAYACWELQHEMDIFVVQLAVKVLTVAQQPSYLLAGQRAK